ncbi:EAL domain-containing protein [bacterium]|nr:EAL domain-containing protein [bacterium]MBU1990406.1 EAL domain-containing protein [bacterium]
MNFFNKPLIFIAVFALSFFILNESFSYYFGLEKAKTEFYEKDRLILTNLIAAQSKNIETLAEVLASDERVKQGYIQNDPEIIKKHVFPIWNRIKDKKITYEIHFFKPPAISFVNFSNFKSIGNDVSSVRTDILWITSSFKSSSHALMCKTYAGYRATHPIIDDNGTMLGGLSLGKKIDWIPEAIKERTTHDSFLIYTKESTNSLMKKYYEHFIKDKEVVGDYILADKTIPVAAEDIKGIDYTKNIQDIVIADKSYTLYSYPIIDFNKETMGYVFTLTQLEEFKERFSANLIKNFIIIVLTALLIFLITRRSTITLLKQIHFIKEITKEIKKRNFKPLHKLSFNSKTVAVPLIDLEKDILEMGLELEKQYTILEDDNREKTQQLIKQLYTDEVTGLANRNALFKDLEKNKDAFVAIFNIRSFKEINDAFGFEAGNHILKEVAKRLVPHTKQKEFNTYRVGSDEFVIINNIEDISKIAFKEFIIDMIDKVEHTFFDFENEDINISVNIYAGICLDKNKRLEKADMALTQAKKDRKDYVIYSEKENTQDMHINNIQIINKITKALQNDNIIVYYQAIIDKNGDITKYEALVRMRDENTVLSPFYFLDISKRTKHYTAISKVVIEKTFQKCQECSKAFSINLTADDILNEGTVVLIKNKMLTLQDPTKVVFELVESDDLYNLPEIKNFIIDIKKMGAKIAIDDFGTGYSNFSYMMKIQPDYLKIDGSLIKNINSDKNAYKIVKTIVSFSKELNIKTIAEFVHSKEIYEVCKAIGIDEFQGYYFSEPKSEL